MKTIIFVHALTCLCAATIISPAASAQPADFVRLNIQMSKGFTPEYKTMMPANTATAYRNEINTRAVRAFVKAFRHARQVSWYKGDNGGFIAKFTSDSIKTRVTYSRRGSWQSTLKTYGQDKMPPRLRAVVRSSFPDHAIIEVTEVQRPEYQANILYSIIIKNNRNWKIVQIREGEMTITNDFNEPK